MGVMGGVGGFGLALSHARDVYPISASEKPDPCTRALFPPFFFFFLEGGWSKTPACGSLETPFPPPPPHNKEKGAVLRIWESTRNPGLLLSYLGFPEPLALQ